MCFQEFKQIVLSSERELSGCVKLLSELVFASSVCTNAARSSAGNAFQVSMREEGTEACFPLVTAMFCDSACSLKERIRGERVSVSE